MGFFLLLHSIFLLKNETNFLEDRYWNPAELDHEDITKKGRNRQCIWCILVLHCKNKFFMSWGSCEASTRALAVSVFTVQSSGTCAPWSLKCFKKPHYEFLSMYLPSSLFWGWGWENFVERISLNYYWFIEKLQWINEIQVSSYVWKCHRDQVIRLQHWTFKEKTTQVGILKEKIIRLFSVPCLMSRSILWKLSGILKVFERYCKRYHPSVYCTF